MTVSVALVAAFVFSIISPQIPAPPPSTPAPGEPIVSVWYRGTPAGTPRQSDLGAIRALGFNGVTWPKSAAAQEAELRRLAELVGLVVEVVDKPKLAGPMSALSPGSRIDIAVGMSDGIQVPSLAWRAIAHGARTIAFDSGAAVGAGQPYRGDDPRPPDPSGGWAPGAPGRPQHQQ